MSVISELVAPLKEEIESQKNRADFNFEVATFFQKNSEQWFDKVNDLEEKIVLVKNLLSQIGNISYNMQNESYLQILNPKEQFFRINEMANVAMKEFLNHG